MAANPRQNVRTNRPSGITCSHYEASPGRKHCRHYLDNGACSRPDELMCLEWLKANGQQVPSTSRSRAMDTRRGRDTRRNPLASSPMDLFGNPNPDYQPPADGRGTAALLSTRPSEPQPQARDLFGTRVPVVDPAPPKPKPTPAPVAPLVQPPSEPAIDVDQLRGFTTEDIESFKELGVEVLIESETYGELWLVPRYTSQPRRELTPEHAALLARVLSVFPKSRIVAFEKSPNPERPERLQERS